MSTRQIRLRFRHRLARELHGESIERVPHAGSHSILRVGRSALLLIRACGGLDRERRAWTALRRTDVDLLLNHNAGHVVFLIPELREPLTVPIRELVRHATTAAEFVRLHIRVGARGAVVLAETGADLSRFVGWRPLQRLRTRGPRRSLVPRHSHAQWQTTAAVIGRRHGYQVYVPPADRSTLDARLAHRTDLVRAVSPLPCELSAIASLAHSDAVWWHPDGRWPEVIWEIEYNGDLRAALGRCGNTLEHLSKLGAPPPRFAIASDAARRSEYERKVRAPLFARVGLHEHCTFVPFGTLWEAHRFLR